MHARSVLFVVVCSVPCVGCLVDELEVQGSLNQAAFVEGTTSYRFGHESIPNIPFAGGPDDIDLSRWAMLHDGDRYRLYFFERGSETTIHQYAFNRDTDQYEYGYDSIPELSIVGAPADADPSSFAMLHDGGDYRLYMRGRSNPSMLYQFAFDRATEQYAYGYESIPTIPVTGFPAVADPGSWAMLHDGSHYRVYEFDASTGSGFFQGAYDASVEQYVYGFDSIERLGLESIPGGSDTSDFAMLHDGSNYRFYFLAP